MSTCSCLSMLELNSIHVNKMGSSKLIIIYTLLTIMRETNRQPVYSHRKVLVLWKAFSCHAIITQYIFLCQLRLWPPAFLPGYLLRLNTLATLEDIDYIMIYLSFDISHFACSGGLVLQIWYFLQVYTSGCVVVQIMCHVFMTSLMTR